MISIVGILSIGAISTNIVFGQGGSGGPQGAIRTSQGPTEPPYDVIKGSGGGSGVGGCGGEDCSPNPYNGAGGTGGGGHNPAGPSTSDVVAGGGGQGMGPFVDPTKYTGHCGEGGGGAYEWSTGDPIGSGGGGSSCNR